MQVKRPSAPTLRQKTLSGLLRASALVVMAFFLNNCGDGSSTNVDPTFTSLYTNFFYNNCLQCHQPGGSGTTAGSTLDFTDANTAYSTLIGSTAGGLTSGVNCAGLSLINTTTPAYSFLLGVLSTDYHTSNFAGRSGCTPYTEHHTNLAISQAYSSNVQQALVQWITAGANND